MLISKLSEPKADQDLFILANLRAELTAERSIAFFRTSASVGESFTPLLSIIGVMPSIILQSKNGVTETAHLEGTSVRSRVNPFTVFSKILTERKTPRIPSLPFFQGGALGYFGYDAVKFIEPVLQTTKNLKLGSQVYDAEMVFFKNYLIFDHASGAVTLLSEDEAFEKKMKELLMKLPMNTAPAKFREESQPYTEAQALPISAFQSSFGKDAFLESVQKLKTHIKDGDIFQAVLSEKFKMNYNGDALKLFQALLKVNPAPYHFFFSIDGRDFMGASPEMLLKSEGEKIETHPIAGTRPRGKTPEEEKRNEAQLIGSEKECAEHLMLVDLARNDIGRVAKPGSVVVESFQKLRKFGGVMHLVSKVTGTRKTELNSVEAFASCFPAGTLSGAPKIRAMDLLSNLEPETRGFYGGAFVAGSVTGDLDSCIAIRSLSIENGVVTIQAGAGIVADSNPEKEYQEVEQKSRLARTALALAPEKSP